MAVPEPAAGGYTKEERMLMATETLERRAKAITEERECAGRIDAAPMLVDTGHSHVMYVSAALDAMPARCQREASAMRARQ